MKTKQLIGALAFTIVCAATQISCSSKPSDKAEEVQDKKEDVMEAQAEGDSSVKDEQAELDSARKDYREAVKDSIKNQ
ncbi:hypothetical protein [Spirosoma sp.]|uniref:hypothetical protein n=1 Tax=Spirosoma sp. TaxID=1899569 RepID=UPI003B3B31DF